LYLSRLGLKSLSFWFIRVLASCCFSVSFISCQLHGSFWFSAQWMMSRLSSIIVIVLSGRIRIGTVPLGEAASISGGLFFSSISLSSTLVWL